MTQALAFSVSLTQQPSSADRWKCVPSSRGVLLGTASFHLLGRPDGASEGILLISSATQHFLTILSAPAPQRLLSRTEPLPRQVGSLGQPQDFLPISKLLPCPEEGRAQDPDRSGSLLPTEDTADETSSLVSLDSQSVLPRATRDTRQTSLVDVPRSPLGGSSLCVCSVRL